MAVFAVLYQAPACSYRTQAADQKSAHTHPSPYPSIITDHVSGTAKLKMLIPGLKSAIAGVSGAAADLCLSDGDVVTIGSRHLTVHTTPGHTDGCVSFATDDKVRVPLRRARHYYCGPCIAL